jgi:hypothetical protein
MNTEIQAFLSTFGDELRSKVNRLDNIIGRDHWLSVGNYKESIVRNFLRSTLPKKYEVSTGFILSKDFKGNLIKSKQIDIMIWDSSNYSSIFRDDEFVIIPPEACRVIIEVKGKLKLSDISKTINCFDQTSFFLGVEYNQGFNISRYIFAFDLEQNISFPSSVIKKCAKSYENSRIIKLTERTKLINKYVGRDKFAFDGIYILGSGLISSSVRSNKKDEMCIILQSFETDNQDYLYSLFETEIQSHLGDRSNGNTGMYYTDQPGLLAIKNTLKFHPTFPKSILITPKIHKDELYSDINPEIVFEESFI